MGRTNEFTLVAPADEVIELGVAVQVGTTLDHNTPVAKIAPATEEIDGIVTDITAGHKNLLAVAKLGDIVFAKLGVNGATVGDILQVGTNGRLIKHTSGVAVAKALATGVEDELVPVIIK